MKTRNFSRFIIAILVLYSGIASAQFDDLYYDYKKDKTIITAKNTSTSSTNYSDENDYEYESTYDADEYDNYDEYTYATRINRFHRPVVQNIYYNNFDSWWSNSYFDPYWNTGWNSWNNGWNNYSVNVFIGSPWRRYNAWNYYNPYSWNSWNVGWGGYNPWGWNSWNSCGSNLWSNYGYYGSGYYGGGYYGNNWAGNYYNRVGNNNENTYKNFGSRKGGSISSSVAGRDASPRRSAVTGGNDRNTHITKEIQREDDGQTTNRTSGRIYKGDIKGNTDTQREQRVRINSGDPDTGSRGDINRRNEKTNNERVKSNRDSEKVIRPNDSNRNTNTRIFDNSASRRSSNNGDSGSSRSNNNNNNNNDYNNSSTRNSWDTGSSSRPSYDSGSSMRNSGNSGSSNSSSGNSGGGGRSSRRGGGI
jgi:hypothetical protein